MNKISETIYEKVLLLDWDGVIDLTSDDKYAESLGKIDYRTTREYAENLKKDLDEAEQTSDESFDDAQKNYAEKMQKHYELKDKYLLERTNGNFMARYSKSIKEIAKQMIKRDLKDENIDDLIEALRDEFPKEDKYLIGRYVGLLLHARQLAEKEVDVIMKTDFPDEDREELIDMMTDFIFVDLTTNNKEGIDSFGKIPYRRIISGISSESANYVHDLATSGRYGLTIIASHCNVKREVFFKDRIIRKLFSKDGVMFIPIPYYPTILKDGLNENEINNLRIELKAFDIDLDSEKKPTSKINYIRYYLYKHKNKFINEPSQITLVDNSSRNVNDCNENGGIGIYFKPGTTNDNEVGSLALNEIIKAEESLTIKKGK